jgi:hypothetical protein
MFVLLSNAKRNVPGMSDGTAFLAQCDEAARGLNVKFHSMETTEEIVI